MFVQRLRASLVAAVSWAACRLPEGPLIRLAEVGGELWYRLDRSRAAQGRRNLRRVCEWLDAQGVGPERARAAATDPQSLERLLRSAFRHQARYYLEVATTPSMRPAYIRDRLTVETPDVIAEAFATPGPLVFVGLHFGAIELPALFLADRAQRVATAPMETIDDPPLQEWFRRTRGSVGLRIVGLREARRELVAALGRGEPVGLVADRDITGGGILTMLFGHRASMPVGPALIALEHDVPIYVAAVRRTGRGRYRGGIERIRFPTEGTSRERVTAFLATEARAFERVIAVAPEQWWAVFFPIWPDLDERANRLRDR
jgi:KDO2-lipid IV(A) lauroyltransferase